MQGPSSMPMYGETDGPDTSRRGRLRGHHDLMVREDTCPRLCM
jgi:hypothetical protein